jgi:hypothetical protein
MRYITEKLTACILSSQRCSAMLVPVYQVHDRSVGTFLQNYKLSVLEGCNHKLDDFCTKSCNTHYYVQNRVTPIIMYKNRSHKWVDDTSTEEFNFYRVKILAVRWPTSVVIFCRTYGGRFSWGVCNELASWKYVTWNFVLPLLTLRLLMSCIYMELLVKPEILSSYIYIYIYIYMDLRLAMLKAVSLYLLQNVSILNQCRKLSCVTVVCKHLGSYQGYPN